MNTNRTSFNTTPNIDLNFKEKINPVKSVYDTSTFDSISGKTPSKRGRPKTVRDPKKLATVPKKISVVTNTKLDNLKPYISELADVKNITFDLILDTLIESYITKNLPVSKEELLRNQISNDLK